jgi:probable phosphomutase (TIGR03848 family)
MTRFLLIRHGLTDTVGHSIASWTPGVHLNAEGRRQAAALAERLDGIPIQAIYSSPLERALETAEPLAERRGLPVQVREAFGEVRFGKFSGHTLEHLARHPAWRVYHKFRSGVRAPGGELAVEVQARFVSELRDICVKHLQETVAVVSHADAIKAVVALFLGVSLDLFDRILIAPASVTVLDLFQDRVLVHRVNWTPEL